MFDGGEGEPDDVGGAGGNTYGDGYKWQGTDAEIVAALFDEGEGVGLETLLD